MLTDINALTIARAAGRPEARDMILPPDPAQPSEKFSRSSHCGKLSGS
ncbi:hypothetical protein [Brachybacterium avium]|nr:hypothetical protein [Brachybacterium avium]